MKRSVRLLAVLLCCGALLATAALAAGTYSKTLEAYYRDIKLSINGVLTVPKDVNGNVVDPFIVDGTTYLPVRAVSEALGKSVDWDDPTSTVLITDPAPGIEGTWKTVRVSLDGEDQPVNTFAGGSFSMELKSDKTGIWTINTESFPITWTEENGALTIVDEASFETYGTITGNTMVLNIEGTLVTLSK